MSVNLYEKALLLVKNLLGITGLIYLLANITKEGIFKIRDHLDPANHNLKASEYAEPTYFKIDILNYNLCQYYC